MVFFIDLTASSYYYSSMNVKALLMTACCITLGACQHAPETTTIDSPQPTYGEPSVSPSTTHDAQIISGHQQPAISSDNVIERIRNGFRFPDLESKYVRDYEKWNSSHPTYLANLFKRSEPFLFHIVEEIEKRGLPMELALLPAIESSYKPNAVSRSKAVGLWQFIPSTGRSFGLNQDWWYDGRRDVLLSTNAALDYLTALNKRFNGDWFLTLAAYNAGQGTVARAIRQNKRKGKKTTYQHLSLRSETRRYVPKIIALKKILNNPEAYNFSLPVVANKPHFTVLPINGQIDLRKFAKDSQIDYDQLRNLNAGFLRWASAPNAPQRLLIPISSEGQLAAARLAAQEVVEIEYQRHQISRGETLSGIARRYGVSVQALKTTNSLRSSAIRAGKQLLIPINGSQVASTNTTEPATQNEKQQIIHQVQRGDTLWAIARKYKVRVEELLAWNQLSKNSILKLDQSLVLFPN